MNWIVWALLSAFFAALTALLAKEGVAHVDSNLATAVRTTVVLVIAWLVAIGFGGIHEISSLTRRTLIFLCASGVATGLSWLCYYRALQLGPVSKVAPIDKLSVAMAIVLGLLFLGEKPSLPLLIGGVLIVAGAIVIAVF